jgi:hypothetical protein
MRQTQPYSETSSSTKPTSSLPKERLRRRSMMPLSPNAAPPGWEKPAGESLAKSLNLSVMRNEKTG